MRYPTLRSQHMRSIYHSIALGSQGCRLLMKVYAPPPGAYHAWSKFWPQNLFLVNNFCCGHCIICLRCGICRAFLWLSYEYLKSMVACTKRPQYHLAKNMVFYLGQNRLTLDGCIFWWVCLIGSKWVPFDRAWLSTFSMYLESLCPSP